MMCTWRMQTRAAPRRRRPGATAACSRTCHARGRSAQARVAPLRAAQAANRLGRAPSRAVPDRRKRHLSNGGRTLAQSRRQSRSPQRNARSRRSRIPLLRLRRRHRRPRPAPRARCVRNVPARPSRRRRGAGRRHCRTQRRARASSARARPRAPCSRLAARSSSRRRLRSSASSQRRGFRRASACSKTSSRACRSPELAPREARMSDLGLRKAHQRSSVYLRHAELLRFRSLETGDPNAERKFDPLGRIDHSRS
jgi:hypothetical protein